MPFVRTLDDFTPVARQDGLPFTTARIEESASQTGPWTLLEIKTLSPVDANPSVPAARDFTTALATLVAGWYRVVFVDAAGSKFESDPAYYPDSSSASALTSLSAVRAFMQKQSTDTAQDILIQSLITRASAAITRDTSREFVSAGTAAVTRTFPHYAGRLVSLAPYDLRSASAITVTADSTTSTIATTDYKLRPTPSLTATYQWLRFSTSYRQNESREVAITGLWGMANIPEDVAHWCIVTVVTWLRRDASAFETTFSIPEDRLERPEALPAAVRAGLSHYRTRKLGA